MRVVLALLLVAPLVIGCSKTGDSSGADASKTDGAAASGKFAAVQTILTTNCAKCHSGDRPKAGINLSSYEGVMKGGMEGPIVTAGDPDGSKLIKALKGQGAKQMPPRSSIPATDIATIEAWIKDGAKIG